MMRNCRGDDSVCRRCDRDAEPEAEMVACQSCGIEFASGRLHYSCENCGRDWVTGARTFSSWNQKPVCKQCSDTVIGRCGLCGQDVRVRHAVKWDSRVICRKCHETEEEIWCPKCAKIFPYSGYLRLAFRDDRAGLHAAALVTHYRHHHVKSHDRAWDNPHYAEKIPNYDYDKYKAMVNNRAKRQLIRAIKKHVKDGTYPETTGVLKPSELVAAFSRLRENDDKTSHLIDKVLVALK